MSFRNQTRRWDRQMLSWISPKQLALLLLGTVILSFGMHNIHRRVGISEGGVRGMGLLLDPLLSLPPWLMPPGLDLIGYLLGLPTKKLDAIIYYERYVVIQPGILEGEVAQFDLLEEGEYLDLLEKLPSDNQYLEDSDPNKFVAKMGAEAIYDLLSRIDLDSLSYELRNRAGSDASQQRKTEALKRLQVVESFRASRGRNKPEWMIVRIVPVIPPELRPLVPLDGGRFHFRPERPLPSRHHP